MTTHFPKARSGKLPTCAEYINEDPQVARLIELSNERHEKIREVQGEIQTSLFKITRMMTAGSLIMEKVYTLNDMSDKKSDLLKDVTAYDAEVWASDFAHVTTELRDIAVQEAINIARADKEVRKLQATCEGHKLAAARKQAREAWETLKAREEKLEVANAKAAAMKETQKEPKEETT